MLTTLQAVTVGSRLPLYVKFNILEGNEGGLFDLKPVREYGEHRQKAGKFQHRDQAPSLLRQDSVIKFSNFMHFLTQGRTTWGCLGMLSIPNDG